MKPPSWTIHRTLRRGWKYLTRPQVQRGIAITLTALTAAGLGIFLYNNLEALRNVEWQFTPYPLVLSFAAYSLALGLAILIWSQVMAALGLRTPWMTHVYVYCVTNLAKRIPGVLWYVAGRLILYPDNPVNKWAISVGSALELVLTVISGAVVGLTLWPGAVAGFFDPLWFVVVIAAGLVAVHPRIIRSLLRWLGAEQGQVAARSLQYRQILVWSGMYGGIWLAGGVVLFALIQVVYPIPFGWLPRVIGAWSLSGMVSIVSVLLPLGLGLRELTLGLLLATFLPDGVALVIAILARLVLTAYELIWVLVVYWGKRHTHPLLLR